MIKINSWPYTCSKPFRCLHEKFSLCMFLSQGLYSDKYLLRTHRRTFIKLNVGTQTRSVNKTFKQHWASESENSWIMHKKCCQTWKWCSCIITVFQLYNSSHPLAHLHLKTEAIWYNIESDHYTKFNMVLTWKASIKKVQIPKTLTFFFSPGAEITDLTTCQ